MGTHLLEDPLAQKADDRLVGSVVCRFAIKIRHKWINVKLFQFAQDMLKRKMKELLTDIPKIVRINPRPTYLYSRTLRFHLDK
jgi:hypothetical protein